ncbi:MAG TPA: rod shape-determining protein MreC [candidate division Zixibacteria bacterium]|nr:rod shape-determining protein MreC [candidate division Zixibacteria bacterium]HEQ97815.1 rod shape-determining protein MreC [candidate division Zixibacteria bacterium]
MTAILRKLFGENKEVGLAIILAALSFVILILPLDLKRPMAKYTYLVTLSPFQGVSEKIKRLAETTQTNKWLREQLLKRELELILVREALEQNERLRDSLGFRQVGGFTVIPGELKQIDPKRRDNALIVSVREDHEVAPDMAVVSLSGLVGKTTHVMINTVTVELLTSPNCRVAARDQNTRTMGIIRWESGNDLLLDNVPVRDPVNVGDTVISSGLGGLFPEGLPIGVVSEVELPERGFFKDIKVRPFVDFNRIDELFILKQPKETEG